MKKLVQVSPGEIFAIPLFLSEEPATKSFSRYNFNEGDNNFAFCRIIEDQKGSGIIIEVFNKVGYLNTNIDVIISSGRMFKPVAISGLGIEKKRWRKIHTQENYDKERDSLYSEIQLVYGPPDNLRLWQNGQVTPINTEKAENYEFWKIWMTDQLEKRIIGSCQLSAS